MPFGPAASIEDAPPDAVGYRGSIRGHARFERECTRSNVRRRADVGLPVQQGRGGVGFAREVVEGAHIRDVVGGRVREQSIAAPLRKIHLARSSFVGNLRLRVGRGKPGIGTFFSGCAAAPQDKASTAIRPITAIAAVRQRLVPPVPHANTTRASSR